MKKIIMYNKREVLVDDEDYEYLNKYKWTMTNDSGYNYAKSDMIRMHILIMKPSNGMVVDHINHNGLDNRKCNLRVCTISENFMNSRKHKDNTTGYKGVFLNDQGKYYSKCKKGKITLIGGSSSSSYYAALDYNKFAKQLHGEFACLNEISFEDKVKMFYRGEIHEFPKRAIMT